METILNLTPHIVVVLGADGTQVAELPPTGRVARVATTVEDAGEIAGIPVVKTRFGEIIDLPEPEDGTFFVVSSLLAGAAKETGRGASDLLVPGRLIRDSAGQPIGCEKLSLA